MDNYGQVYKITNKINNKIYIGITIHEDVINGRYSGNLLNTHNNHLKSSILKYGIENFSVETLCFVSTREDMENKEKEYIALYNSTNTKYGYNQHIGGIGGRMSDEIIAIISKKSKEMWDSRPEMKENLIKRNKSNKVTHTDETKKQISETRKERIKSGEIDISKNLELIHTNPEIKRKRVESNSKYWYVQYDSYFKEINRWVTLKDMWKYMCDNGIETISYGGFKNKKKQKIVFGENLYNNFYWRKINK